LRPALLLAQLAQPPAQTRLVRTSGLTRP
jgi:hypothetical protein